MKLRDFKNEPEKYKKIIALSKERGIEVSDETDIENLIGEFHSVNAIVMAAGWKLDKKRQGIL